MVERLGAWGDWVAGCPLQARPSSQACQLAQATGFLDTKIGPNLCRPKLEASLKIPYQKLPGSKNYFFPKQALHVGVLTVLEGERSVRELPASSAGELCFH